MKFTNAEYNNSAGRLEQVSNGNQGGFYRYNALGQRIKKTANGQSIYFNYDEQGKLIGEYNSNGNAVREYIYLGNQPIALFSSEKENEVLQIHTDHLGSPRVVTDKNKSVLWKMEGDQFGDVQPQISSIKMPLRHAGQYFDSESELFYNYFRYYDPKTGRYLRSDPIGLEGGLNTFGYVGGSPLSYVDFLGLYTLNEAQSSLSKNPNISPAGRRNRRTGIRKYSDTQIFDEWLRLERKDKSWINELPKCPKRINMCDDSEWEIEKSSYKNGWMYFHEGASWEARSNTTTGGHSNQCTYDRNGDLILNIPSAGSADFRACNSQSCEGHYAHDVLTYQLAKKLKRINDYFDVRPIVK